MNLIAPVVVAAVAGLASIAFAQPTTVPAIAFPPVGKIAPRSAAQISASDWSVVGETLDRDFASYPNYKQYLGPLGAKALRVQCGWAKCEKRPGVYDFAWLDEVVNDAISQGVQPWLETGYGNLLYPGGGGTGLGDGIPTSAQALTAWDNWVRALVVRYKDRVHEWEIWNEPDLSDDIQPQLFAAFHIRTARIIRAEQPAARIYALGLAGRDPFLTEFLHEISDKGALGLIDAITVHGYPTNPDDIGSVERARAIAASFSDRIQIRQGETGCPSTQGTFGALRGHPWTERSQAKWDARRMLSHYASGVPFNLFTLMELHYTTAGGVKVNTKGLLKSNPDKTVARPKPAYYAAQNIFAIFDRTLTRADDYPFRATADKLVLHAYAQQPTSKQILTLWIGGAAPADEDRPTLVDLTLPRGRFEEAVYVDLLSGAIHAIPDANRSRQPDGSLVLKHLPVFDYPIAIAERSLLPR